jgi:hypothetical protein
MPATATREFTSNLKKIVLGATHQTQFANCLIQDDSAVLPLPYSLNESFQTYEVQTEEEEDSSSREYINSILTQSEYKSDVLGYIAGYVQKTILTREQCSQCKIYLTDMKMVESNLLLDIKNRGPLCIPSGEVVKIVKVAHSVVEKRLHEPDLLTEKNVVEKLAIKTVNILNGLYPSLMENLSQHADVCSIFSSHKIKLMKKISSFYITTLLHHFCRQYNNKDARIRNMYSKLILFKNQ